MAEVDMFDIVILGGGPAGLSAAMWSSELGLHAIVLERSGRPGGQLHWIHTPIRNYPGIDLENGADLLARLTDQLSRTEIDIRTGVKITAVNVQERSVTLDDGVIRAKILIIATGVRRGKLGVPGEDDLAGRGILETGQINRELLKGKKLMIVGGGDAAFENAGILSTFADRVYLLHRRDIFAARPQFIKAVMNDPRVEIITDAVVQKVSGGDRLETVEYLDRTTNDVKTLAVDAMLIRIGVIPNSDMFAKDLEVDDRGFCRISARCETSRPYVFAIGDVANPSSPTLITSVGMGATAVKAARAIIHPTKA